MKSVITPILIAASLAACSPAETPETATAPSEAGVASIVVSNGHIRPPLGGKTITAGYFTMVSPIDDALIGARADFAETIELHDHVMADGMMQMRKVNEVPAPAGSPVSFAPHGLHLMIFGVDGLVENETRKVTLVFSSGAEVDAEFSVSAP